MLDEANGKKVAGLEVKIDIIAKQVNGIEKMLEGWFLAGGLCENSRRRSESAIEQLKIIWWILGITLPMILSLLIKLAFFK